MAKKQKTVTIEVTNQGAVYVNNTRITGRETKWGIHHTLFTAKAPANKVKETLVNNGFGHIRLDQEYMEEIKVE